MYHYPPSISFTDKIYGLIYSNDAIRIMNRQFSKRGDSYTVKSSLFANKFIFTKNQKLIQHFLQKNHRNYEKSVLQTEMLQKYLGNGLLTNKGESWRRQRRLIQPGFSHKKIESLNDIMLAETEDFIENIPLNETLDFYPIFNQLTFNVVAASLFSVKLSEEESAKITKVLTKSQDYFIKETRNPVDQFTINYLGKFKKLYKEIEEVRGIFKRMIEARKQSKNTYHDLLDMLMHTTYEDTGLPMEEEQLIDEILILFIAGHETTANALSFTFCLLGENSKYQTQIQDILAQEADQMYSLDTLFKPSLFQNILQESMRLYPPAWIFDREALADDECMGYSWEKGTVLVGSVFHMNRSVENWKQPTQFIPERFTDPTTKKKVLIPFGSGPRYCIGEHFAKMEMLLVLKNFFSQYTFQTQQPQIELEALVTLRPKSILGVKKKR